MSVRETEVTTGSPGWSGRRITPLKTFGGRGSESICDFCRTRVEKDDIEFEVDGEIDGELVTLHLHQRCHDVALAHSAIIDL
jgi:hypothetical protein